MGRPAARQFYARLFVLHASKRDQVCGIDKNTNFTRAFRSEAYVSQIIDKI